MSLILQKYLTGYKHIIWDFNGTILDDTELSFSVLSCQLKKYNLQKITKKEYREQFSFPIYNYYQKLGFNYKKTSFNQVSNDFIKDYMKRLDEANLFPDIKTILATNYKQGRKQSILSAARYDHLIKYLNKLNINQFFNHIYGLSNYYAKGKFKIGKQLMQKLNLNTNNILLIGDTDHDLAVGDYLGINVLLIADGHQTYQRLQQIHNNVLYSRYLK